MNKINLTKEHFKHAADGRVVTVGSVVTKGIRDGRKFIVRKDGWSGCIQVVYNPIYVDEIVDNSTKVFPVGTFVGQGDQPVMLELLKPMVLAVETKTIAYDGARQPSRYTWPAGTTLIRSSFGSPECAGRMGVIYPKEA